MATSHHADVVIAEGEPTSSAEELAADILDEIEAVDVAPDPTRRFVVIAPTKQAGQKQADALSIDPVAIVTPRSPYGARGMVADEIVEAEGLTAEERDALTLEVAPALTTSKTE